MLKRRKVKPAPDLPGSRPPPRGTMPMLTEEIMKQDAELARAEARKRLGMPISLIGSELGLTPEQIAAWEESDQAKKDEEAAQAQQGGFGNAN